MEKAAFFKLSPKNFEKRLKNATFSEINENFCVKKFFNFLTFFKQNFLKNISKSKFLQSQKNILHLKCVLK